MPRHSTEARTRLGYLLAGARSATHAIVSELRAADLLRLPRFVRTSSFRITLVYSGLFCLSAALLCGLIYWISTSYVAGQIDAAVSTEIAEEQADGGVTLAGLTHVIAAQALHARPGAYYLLQSRAGQVLAGNLPAMSPQTGTREWHAADGLALRGRGVNGPEGSYLLVGLAATNLQELRGAIGYAFLWIVFGTLALALLGGSALSFGVLSRVESISRASRAIVAGDLDQRIALRGTGDEFDHLAASLNAMLDRIETLMQGMRQVSSDIAHDLRTPLSRHRQRLELALIEGGSEQELRLALQASLADVDAILETFSALLRIARLEAGADPQEIAILDLAALAEDVTEAYRAVAEERGQSLTCTVAGPASVPGSRILLTQLLANLIENALRHTPPGTTIAVRVETEAGQPSAFIIDNGPGIPAALRAAVFRPFFRQESSRNTPGTGLGLSLVAAIAKLHSASVTLTDNAPGLHVAIRFHPKPESETDKRPPWQPHVEALLRKYLPAREAAWSIAWLLRVHATANSTWLRIRDGRGTVRRKPRT